MASKLGTTHKNHNKQTSHTSDWKSDGAKIVEE